MSEDTTTTTYTDSALVDRIKDFLKSYKADGKYIYIDTIDTMMAENITSIKVNYVDFTTHTNLEKQFREKPDRIIQAFARAIKETLQIRYPGYAKQVKDEISVRITDYPLKNTVREINSKTTGQFISIKAILIRMSVVESIPKVAVYVCPDDHPTILLAKRNYNVGVPIVCSNPACKHREFELHQESSTFVDYQILQLQELPSELPPGKLPKTLGVFVAGNLVDTARMGDTVEISGIVRAELSNKIKLGKEVQTYRHRLYANNIETIYTENDFGSGPSEKDIKQITSISEMDEDTVTTKIINSFAPHIKGHELYKEAIILTMIGADAQKLQDGTRIRGDINTFLVGDPGTAKSEMGKAAYRVAPRAFYASGRGSSGAGLTAATIKDNITGVYMLEPGVTVLADKGLAVIDEFDKMKPEDRSALHEVMEQQTVSISKGGITATLNARAAILAIANPSLGKYDPYKNLTENIPSIPIPLLTRFDMIFVVRDIPSREKDEQIARHILSTHKNSVANTESNSWDMEFFAKYLIFAKQKHPKLSTDAEEKIVDYYLKMRNSDDGTTGFVITPRQFEGLIRLTVARAKFLLKESADENDAARAIHIMEEMFKNSGVDVNTGKVDLGVLQGTPKSEIGKASLFQDIMQGLETGTQHGIVIKEILDEMVKSGKWDEDSAKEFFTKMIRNSMVFEASPNHYSWVSQ